MRAYTVENFVGQASSKEPVPGGGSVSALVGALGMALGSMVGNLTIGKRKYDDVQFQILQLIKESEVIQNRLMELIEEDAKAFKPLAKAYGMPNGTEEERLNKEHVMQTVLMDATFVPLEIARWAQKAIELHKIYLKIGNEIAISDVGVGAVLCQAAVRGATLNVLINTKHFKDEKLKKKIEDEIFIIERTATQDVEEIYREVEAAIR